ncbi:hypothetical protein [Nioella aestuarii]|uniref:hypothetical protein n=1 Tax=Nioella aestuarii TaxID=1662864 RepID=UPI003D7FC853
MRIRIAVGFGDRCPCPLPSLCRTLALKSGMVEINSCAFAASKALVVGIGFFGLGRKNVGERIENDLDTKRVQIVF